MAVEKAQAAADKILRRAIAARRLVAFYLDERRRVAEPHDYGVINGVPRLFFWQVGGESRSAPPVGWRWGVLSKLSRLELLDERFAGPRPTLSGEHHRWDVLIASVSRPAKRRRSVKASGSSKAKKQRQ
jgi:hypothetical protein